MKSATASPPSVSELAVFGGVPTFSEPRYVGKPNLGDRAGFLRRVEDMLDRLVFSNDGPYARELETRIAELCGVRHFVATTNGTVAEELLIEALGIRGEVLVPSFTFIATVHALRWRGVTPVFCDVDPTTFTIDPEDVRRRITKRTAAIIGVHVWGRSCEVEALQAIADEHRIPLLFDAAHALGCTRGGRPVGSFGKAEWLSLHATKFASAFEGGGITTDDDALATKLRRLRNFGFTGVDRVEGLGTNAKMSEVCAAMGLTSLDALERIVQQNLEHHGAYREALADVPGITIVPLPPGERSNGQYVVLRVLEEATLGRDELMTILAAENLKVRRYFYPGCHRHQPYAGEAPPGGYELPHTDRIAGEVLCLPTGFGMTHDDVARAAALIRFVVAHGSELHGRVPVAV